MIALRRQLSKIGVSFSKLSRLKLRIYIVILILIAGFISLLLNPSSPISLRKAPSLESTRTLMKQGNCENAMLTLKKVKVDTDKPTESVDMLNYRADCYTKAGDYRAALVDVLQIRAIYEKRRNTEKLKELSYQKDFLEAAIKRDPRTYSASNRNEVVSPEFAKQLKDSENIQQ